MLQEHTEQTEACETGGDNAVMINDAAAPLPEAAASANTYVEIAGRRCQVTLRDFDEGRLLDRLSKLLERFPVDAPPPDIPANPGIPSDPAPDETWCGIHQVRMDEHENERGTWFSHWLPETEKWCKGRSSRRAGGHAP